jgi:hypothetical protein
MINLFPLHDETTAPEAARDALAATNANFGMIPNSSSTVVPRFRPFEALKPAGFLGSYLGREIVWC